MDLNVRTLHFVTLFLTASCVAANGTGFTFELPDRKRFCFGERFEGPEEYIAEYRVIKGGKQDVDFHVKSPNGKILHTKSRVKNGSFEFESSRGDFAFCFSNEFSTWNHKTIYFDLRPLNIDSLAKEAGNDKPFVKTALESSCDVMHEKMTSVVKFQRDYRLKESLGRYLAETLHGHVTWWSVTQTLAILITGIGQSFMLKRFFTEKTSDAVIKEET